MLLLAFLGTYENNTVASLGIGVPSGALQGNLINKVSDRQKSAEMGYSMMPFICSCHCFHLFFQFLEEHKKRYHWDDLCRGPSNQLHDMHQVIQDLGENTHNHFFREKAHLTSNHFPQNCIYILFFGVSIFL